MEERITKEITKMFEKTLDYVQIICTDEYVYKQIRSKILRVGNDCIRNCNNILNSGD